MSKAAPRLRLWLVRHGVTRWAAEGRHTSRTDLELTEEGRAEAADLASLLCPVDFVAVFSSPALRCRQTAELAGLGSKMQVEPDLAEWDYGDYEGLTTQEILARRPGWSLWTEGAPKGETPSSVLGRAKRFLERLEGLDGDVCCFTHGHFSRVLAGAWVSGELCFAASLAGLNPASMAMLGYERQRRVLMVWNLPSRS